MQELFRLRDALLVEVSLQEIFPALEWHTFITRTEVTGEVIDRIGCVFVTEEDIREYAHASQQDARHWSYGEGRRFLMQPIVREECGAIVTYRGPYEDCGAHGYELGLWRTQKAEKPEDDRFPEICFHPIQIAYRAATTLTAKRAF